MAVGVELQITSVAREMLDAEVQPRLAKRNWIVVARLDFNLTNLAFAVPIVRSSLACPDLAFNDKFFKSLF